LQRVIYHRYEQEIALPRIFLGMRRTREWSVRKLMASNASPTQLFAAAAVATTPGVRRVHGRFLYSSMWLDRQPEHDETRTVLTLLPPERLTPWPRRSSRAEDLTELIRNERAPGLEGKRDHTVDPSEL